MTDTWDMQRPTGHSADSLINKFPPTIPNDSSRHKEAFWLSLIALVVGALACLAFYLFVSLAPATNAIPHSNRLIAVYILSIAVALTLVVGVARWQYRRMEEARLLVQSSAKSAQEFLQGILDASFDAIISIDAAQKITYFSRQAEAIFGYRAEEMIGTPLDVLIPSQSRRRHDELARNFTTGTGTARSMGKWRIVAGLTKDGREISTITRIVHHHDINGAPMATAAVRDMTEAEKREILLSRTLAEVARSDKRLRAFFAQFTHELRTPLNAVVGFSELSLHHVQQDSRDQAEEYLRYVVEASNRLSDLIENILEYHRIDDLVDESAIEEVNIIEIVTAAARRINRQADKEILALEMTATSFPVFSIPEMIENYFEVFFDLVTTRGNEPRSLRLDVQGEAILLSDAADPRASVLASIFCGLDRLNNLNFDDVIHSSDSMDMRLFSLWKLADICQISSEMPSSSSPALKLTFGGARQPLVYRKADGTISESILTQPTKKAKARPLRMLDRQGSA